MPDRRGSELLRRARRAFVRQHDHADCGAAALAAVVRFHGGVPRLERLRALSGTARDGATLFGLFQAAQSMELAAEAYEASLADLEGLRQPAILHVVKHGRLLHFVVCFGFDGERFVIGDPADGIRHLKPAELADMWQSRALLILTPTEAFERAPEPRGHRARWFWWLVRADLNVLGLALALGVAIAVLSLATAVFLQKLIDDILPAGDTERLVVGLALLAMLLLARSGLSYARGRFLLAQGRDFNVRVVGSFYGALLGLPQAFFDRRRTGDLIARLNDTGRLQQAVTFVAGEMVIDALLVISATAIIYYYSPVLGLAAAACVPLYLIVAARFHRPVLEGQHAVMEAHALNESNYVDTLQGAAVIRTSGRQERFARQAAEIFRYSQDRIYDLGRVGLRFGLWAEVAGTAVLLAALAGGALMVLRGTLQTGAFVAILQMTASMLPAAFRLALTNIQLQEARVALERMHDLTAVEPEHDPAADAALHQPTELEHLSVEHLCFGFPGRPLLLSDVSFEVRRGEMVALLGESGGGKTTTLHILQRLYAPVGGRIRADGVEWGALSTAGWRALTAAVPQHVKLFEGTLVENICLGYAADEWEAVVAFCRQIGLAPYFEAMPQGYATLLGEEGVNLSGGQQQLVALARALYRRPRLLLLDEATSAMDRQTENHVLDLLDRLRPEMAIVMVTHRPRSAARADRIYVIEGGAVTAARFPASLDTDEEAGRILMPGHRDSASKLDNAQEDVFIG
jgi:ATP-binding cassette, subfamily C, bacteriocin exporter